MAPLGYWTCAVALLRNGKDVTVWWVYKNTRRICECESGYQAKKIIRALKAAEKGEKE